MVAELLAMHGEETPEKPITPQQKEPPDPPEPSAAKHESLASFERDLPKEPWSGDMPAPSAAASFVAEKALEPPPSPIVSVAPRETASFERLLAARAINLARGRLAARDRRAARAAVEEAVNSVTNEQGELPPVTRKRLVAAGLSEVGGLGLIDRLWCDRSVRSIFVNG